MSTPPGGVAETNRRDSALLLDPCKDHPQMFLKFAQDGLVTPRQLSIDELGGASIQERAEVTISLLDLNSADLVSLRNDEIARRVLQVEGFSYPLGQPAEYIKAGLLRTRIHAGAVRQVAAQRLLNLMDGLSARKVAKFEAHMTLLLQDLLPEFCAAIMDNANAAHREWRHFSDRWHRDARNLLLKVHRTRGPAAFELLCSGVNQTVTRSTHHVGSRPYESAQIIGPAARLRRVQVKNFKAIKALDLHLPDGPPVEATDLSDSPDGDVGAVALLGENGSGKTTILEAIALTLAMPALHSRAAGEGAQVLEPLGLTWKQLLRRTARNRYTKEANIVLTLMDGVVAKKIELTFNARSYKLTGGSEGVNVAVRAYGPLRLLRQLPKASTPVHTPSEGAVSVGNLFDPTISLASPSHYLAVTASEPVFNLARAVLEQLIGGRPMLETETEHDPIVTRDSGGVWIYDDPMEETSSGYQAVIATVCDVIAGLMETVVASSDGELEISDLNSVAGIVLIDEIGAHLHPRWRMSITSTLRSVFPRVQFIMSTHEPLCLRGLHKGEVFTVSRSNQPTRPVEVQAVGLSPSRFRVDQLLTSEYFGLGTTLDPQVEEYHQRYYDLLSKRDLTPNEEVLRDRLRDRIRFAEQPVLGYSRRDQIVMEALDEYLATGGRSVSERRQRRKLIDKIKHNWTRVSYGRSPPSTIDG